MNTVIGSADAIVAWFRMPICASGPCDDFIREEVLGLAYQFDKWAIDKETTILRTPEGRILVKKEVVQGCNLVWFDFVRNKEHKRFRFWMNESSVADLLHKIKSEVKKMGDFMEIMCND